MRVIVAGCGRVGAELTRTLVAAGHGVTVIDKSARAFQRIEDLDVTTIVGFGFDLGTLEQAGIDDADAVAAVTSGDNSNILIARVARENFGKDRVVARIQDPARAEVYERLGIATVASVRWATDQIARLLVPDVDQTEWTDASGLVRLVEVQLPDHWAGRRLADLEDGEPWRIAAVTRTGNGRVYAADMIGQAGDRLHVLVAVADIDALNERVQQSGAAGGH